MITEQIIFLGNFLIQANMRISRVAIKVDSLLWGDSRHSSKLYDLEGYTKRRGYCYRNSTILIVKETNTVTL